MLDLLVSWSKPGGLSKGWWSWRWSGGRFRAWLGGEVQRSKQRSGDVALVVVGAVLGLAGPQRQERLGAIERLDLMGWMVPSRHRRAKLVAVEQHLGEPSTWRLQQLAST
jgi:hypothetical protein